MSLKIPMLLTGFLSAALAGIAADSLTVSAAVLAGLACINFSIQAFVGKTKSE